MPAEPTASSPDLIATLQAGTRLAGCYLLEKRIEPTAQPLWLARDEVIDKKIALHFLPPGTLARSGVAERLRQEVKRARQFVHPRVPRVLDLVEEDDWAAIATEAFAGRPLTAVIEENTHGFFEVAEVWPLVRELCETLGAAHQQRFVHGGLSAADVLVGEGQAKLMNFGIAAALREGGAKPESTDDIFALGVLLHTLLAGAPPYEGAQSKGAPSIAEHRRKLKHRGGDVPENWERVIASCLAEDPAARPATCEEIARELETSGAAAVAAAPAVVEAKAAVESPAPAPVEAEPAAPEPPPVVEAAQPAQPVEENQTEPEPVPARVDAGELAAKVRREEAEEEARDLDDDGYDARPHGAGPSVTTLLILVAFAALVIFICYRVFFSEPTKRTTSSVLDVSLPTATPAPTPEPTPLPATPTPMPVAKKESTPTPAPATPMPATPAPLATPKPMDVAAADPKKIEAEIGELKQAREKVSKELPVTKKAVDAMDAQQKKLADDLKKAETAAADAEKAAADRKKTADDARKAAAAAAEQVAAKKSEIAKAEEQLVRLEMDLKDKERALLDAKATAEAAKSAKPMAATTPVPTIPTPAAAPISDDPRAAFEQKMKELGKALESSPAQKVATPAPEGTKPAMELAKASTPAPEKAAKASADGLINSLGMKLVPLPGADLLVCIWPTRVRDFEVFAKTTGLKSTLWKDPGFKQTPDHPVVNVTWQEAVAFCKWLTIKEQRDGVISEKQSYRLLTDIEWSKAAGLGAETGSTPESRDMGVPDVYPWGKSWPPPTGSGNYTGEETGSDVAIKGYNDGFAWTSPVGSFPANKLGFYDMGGNVWQWCMDSWNAESRAKVLRGASWYNGALKLSLLTSCRVHASPDSSTDNYGFRIALAGADAKGTK